MIKMYGFWRSAASFRVRIALNLKGLAYEEEMIDLDADEQHAPGYRAVNPQAALPTVIIDGGPKLTQSMAILEFLEETHPTPALLPSDPYGRARVRSLALLWAADHHPLIVPRIRTYLEDVLKQDEAARRAWIRHWFREGLAICRWSAGSSMPAWQWTNSPAPCRCVSRARRRSTEASSASGPGGS